MQTRLAATLVTGDEVLGPDALAERAARAATGMARLGVGQGDCVALLLRNDVAFLAATLAAQMLGAYAVPLNWHFKRDELLYILSDCTPKLLIAHADLVGQLDGHLPAELPVVVVPVPPTLARAFRVTGKAPAGSHVDWTEWLRRSPPHAGDGAPAPDSVIYTSGTTGRPKGVRRRPPSPDLARAAEAMRATVFGIGAGDRVLVSAPLYHTAPNYFSLRAVRLAERLVVLPRFDARAFLAAIEEHRISHVYAVPTMFVRLLELPEQERKRYDLGTLRFVLHAGGPCPVAVKRAMIDWLGPVICEYYGSTEHGPLTFCTSEEWLARPGTVGRPAPGVELTIQDEAGRVLGPGETGEIVARNHTHPDFTYHGREAERAELQRGDLVVTGDMGFVDQDGFLFLCDRKRDMVISGGVNIYPAEIEGVLAEHPDIADCAVFGIPDPVFGEALVAMVQPRPGAGRDPDGIRTFLAGRLASYKVPARIEFRDALPREESGKIRKRLLRDALLGAEPGATLPRRSA